MNLSVLKFSFLMVTATVLTTFAFDAKEGDFWVSGGFSFQSIGVKYKDYDSDQDRYNVLHLAPSLRIFPVNHFCVGPEFNWTGIFQGGDNYNTFELKGTLGFVGAAGILYPYLLTSPGGEFGGNDSRFVLPFSAGLMLAVSEHLGLQFEFGLKMAFEQYYTVNTISIGIGVCGFGKNTAISVLNQFMPN